MLIKPDLKDEAIIRCLQDNYKLNVKKISFLPLGADFNTVVYRVTTSNKENYFLKLRSEDFFEAQVSVQKYLSDFGIKQVIPPLTTKTGQLWTNLASFKAILYPYIEGHNSVEAKLSDDQWKQFGATMKKLHSADIPSTIASGIPQETFSSKWREKLKHFLKRIENEIFEEPVAAEMALFLTSKRIEILKLVDMASDLAILLKKQPLKYTLCHADIHGWNLFVDKKGLLYIVDWDTLILAPKERDLMFIGAGISDSGRLPIEEELLFYQGYDPTEINQEAIAYYRFERIIQDITEYCEHIFLSAKRVDERMQSLKYPQSNFLPGGTIERACQQISFHNGTEIFKDIIN